MHGSEPEVSSTQEVHKVCVMISHEFSELVSILTQNRSICHTTCSYIMYRNIYRYIVFSHPPIVSLHMVLILVLPEDAIGS